MARRSNKHVDLSTLSPHPIPLPADPRLPLKMASPAHSTRRRQKNFIFQDLAPLGAFAHAIGAEFLEWRQTKRVKTTESNIVAVRMLFRSLMEARGIILPHDIAAGTPSEWQAAVHSWADAVRADDSIVASTRNAYILDATRFLKHLQVKGRVPRFRLPRGVRNATPVQNRKPTLPEVALKVPGGSKGTPPPEIIALGDEIADLWRQLRALPDADKPTGMLRLINLHLDNLRRCAEQEIRRIWHDHLEAEALIAKADIAEVRHFLQRNNGRSSRSLGSGRGSQSIFGDMKNLLAYLEYEWGGLVPSRFEDPSLYRLITNKYSVADISARLHLITDTAVPFLVPILIDTCMNVGCVYELPTTCLRTSETPGSRAIAWVKWRADAAELEMELPIGSRSQLEPDSDQAVTAPRALECLLKLRTRLVPYVLPEEQNRLLLVRRLGGDVRYETASAAVAPLTEKALEAAWHRFRARHPLLADLPITMDQIRSTVLLKTALETDGNIDAVKRKAQHKQYSTTIRYLAGAAMVALNADKARRVQDFLFVSATAGADELRSRFGIEPEDAARILAQARRKGFGLHCQNDSRGTAPGTMPGKACHRSDYCPVCEERLVVEDVSVAAGMCAFRAHILSQEARLVRERPDRWREVWGPFVLFLNVALERMRPDIRLQGIAQAKRLDFSYLELD